MRQELVLAQARVGELEALVSGKQDEVAALQAQLSLTQTKYRQMIQVIAISAELQWLDIYHHNNVAHSSEELLVRKEFDQNTLLQSSGLIFRFQAKNHGL